MVFIAVVVGVVVVFIVVVVGVVVIFTAVVVVVVVVGLSVVVEVGLKLVEEVVLQCFTVFPSWSKTSNMALKPFISPSLASI